MEAPNLVSEIYEKTNSTVSWITDEIVHIKWKEGVELEIEDIDDVDDSFQKITQGEKVKVLSEMGKFTNISPEARKYAAEQSPDLICLGYVIHSLAQRLILRFYIKIKRRQYPTKVFTSYKEALEWLEAFKA